MYVICILYLFYKSCNAPGNENGMMRCGLFVSANYSAPI